MRSAISGLLLSVVVTGCNTNTVDTRNATVTTPAQVNVLIRSTGIMDAEVQGQPGVTPKVRRELANPLPVAKLDFSVLATATDAENGIKSLSLKMTRDLCLRTSNGGISNAHFATVERKRAEYTNPASAPTQASLGDTGIYNNINVPNDPTDDKAKEKFSDGNLLARRNNNGDLVVDAVGISTKWGMEATNFAGQTTYSDVIYITAGDVSCGIQP